MFSALFGLFSVLVSALTMFAPVIVVLFLLINDSKKKKANTSSATATAHGENNASDSAVEPTPVSAAPPTPPKPADPYKKWNILLYIGSFLLVMAMIIFMNSADDSLVAPTAITLTLLFYIGGIILFKAVPYLKSVGKSFVYTASAVFPFWVISFMTLGMSTQSSWIVASAISLTVFILNALIFKSKVMATFSYIWLFVLAWSLTPGSGDTIGVYWVMLAPMVLGLIPTLLWLCRPKWLPVTFRRPTQAFGMVLTPLFAIASTVSFVVEDFAINYPFLRSIVIAFLLVYVVLHWLRERKYGFFAFGRIVAQLLVCAIFADILNYSYSPFSASESAVITVAVVWLVGFLAQSLIALFIPKKNPTAVMAEHGVQIISLIGILVTPILTSYLNDISLIEVLVYASVSILGVAYALIYKNVFWTIATLVGLLLIPATATNLIDFASTNWFLVAYFTIYGLLALLGYKFFVKKQSVPSFWLALIAILVAGSVVIAASAEENFIEIGWLTLTVLLTLLGFLSNKRWLYELAVYSGALCVFSLVGTVGGAVVRANIQSAARICRPSDMYGGGCTLPDTSLGKNAELAISTIRAYVIPIALLAVSFWKERDEKTFFRKWRFLLGYTVLSISLLVIGWTGGVYWMLPSLITQVAFLVYSVFKDKTWLVWTAITLIAISMLSMYGGHIYIWLGVIGIVLIMIVVWRLTKLNKQKQREDTKQTSIDSHKEKES